MEKSVANIKPAKTLAVLCGLIIVLLPFHATFTAWLGSRYGHFDVIKAWKELLMVPMAIGAGLVLVKNKILRSKLFNNRILRLMAVYCLLTAALGGLAYSAHRVSSGALIFGLIINMRFFVFYGLCYLVASTGPSLKKRWVGLLLLPAVIVVIFGLLQHFVLPADFLKHLGYGPDTLKPYQAVDLKPDYIRLQSTLRGPNPLGAYLILIVSGIAAMILRSRKRLMWLIFGLASTVVLFFIYSRSALAATILAVGLLLWLSVSNAWRKWLVVAGATLLIIAGGLVIGLRHNDRFENIVFHTDEHSQSATSSNFDRAKALKDGAHSVIQRPLGKGTGTAGPASQRNTLSPARISENYFIQIGQEVGVLGLAIFAYINVLVALALWRQRQDSLALVLLVSLLGIALVNFVSHAWADDTLSLIWWGLAGIALAPSAILNTNKSNIAKNENPKKPIKKPKTAN